MKSNQTDNNRKEVETKRQKQKDERNSTKTQTDNKRKEEERKTQKHRD